MAIGGLISDSNLDFQPILPTTESHAASPSGGDIWLEGDVLMCACPDCHAPMTVRLWLMVADCWNCGTSIELTEEQEREARRLWQQHDAGKHSPERVAHRESVSSTDERPMPKPPASIESSPEQSIPPPFRKPPIVTSTPSTSEPAVFGRSTPGMPPKMAGDAARRRLTAADNLARRRFDKRRGPSPWRAALLKDTPAWLVSLVFHMILLILLALLTIPHDDEGKYITLNATVSRELRRPGQEEILDPAEQVRFDLPLPEKVDLQDSKIREAMARADQEARELRLVDWVEPLPDLQQVKQQISNPDGPRTTLAARDPRVRVEMIQQEGGTTLTEAAVARGLRWLAQQQQSDGRWRLDGGANSDSAATSLALLPFLGAGQTHLTGRYREHVASGLRWMIENQTPDGDLRIGSRGNTGMYAHGQGAIVLSEAYLMTGDEQLRQPAQKSIDFIVAAQYPDGGWRYKPNHEASPPERRGDTSVIGWQLMALQSARAARLHIPDETFELAAHFLDSVQYEDGARYAYQPRNRPTHVMTAEALLCRIYQGWGHDHRALLEGVQWLADDHLPSTHETNVYYWYYATQVFHHVGGPLWEQWNLRMRDILVDTQEKHGRHAGSWAPRGDHASAGGRVYMTSLAVCTLEIYYRHLPLFRQIRLDAP